MNYRNFDFLTISENDIFSTLTHEAGHWMGLLHPWSYLECNLPANFRDCSRSGDELCDTPPHLKPSSKITNGENKNCYDNSVISSGNFMNYSDDLNFFTEQQAERMHESLAYYRYDIYNMTKLLTNCTLDFVSLDGGSGGSSYNNNCCNSTTDSYGFKIKSKSEGNFGRSISIDNGLLAVSSYGRVNVFTISDTGIVNEETILVNPNNIGYDFARHVYVKDGKIFISNIDKVLIFEKGSDTSKAAGWSLTQTIYGNGGDVDFGRNILLRNDELIITSEKELVFYRYENSAYVKNWHTYFDGAEDIITSRDNSNLVYNGDYLLVKKWGASQHATKGLYIYKKNDSGNFNGRYLNFTNWNLALTEAPDNKLYGTSLGDDVFVTNVYDLNTFDPLSGNVNLVESFERINGWNHYTDGYAKRYITNNMIILPRYGDGVSFHNLWSPVSNMVINDAENDGLLRPAGYDFNRSELGTTSSLSKNILVVGNYEYNEVFIYNLSSMITEDYDWQFCEMPTGDYTSYKNIKIGLDDGSCNVDFDSGDVKKIFRATESISIKPGTHIQGNISFKVAPSFKLTGGIAVNIPNTTFKANLGMFENLDSAQELDNELLDKIVITPNPTKGVLRIISQEQNTIISLKVFGLGGSTLIDLNNVNNVSNLEIDISGYPSGLYIVTFNMSDGSVINKKIIKE